MSLCCSPTALRMMHFSSTGLLEWENMKLTAVETYAELLPLASYNVLNVFSAI